MRIDLMLASPLLAYGASIFAQAMTEPAAPGWLGIVIQGGSFGLVAYAIVVGLPKLQKDLQHERAQERADFLAAVKAITEFGRVQIEMFRVTFFDEQKETRAYFANESQLMRQLFTETVTSMRSAVHDVRNVAGVAVNKATVAMEVSERLNQAQMNQAKAQN